MPRRQPRWNPDRWRSRCAWCAKKMPDDAEVFGISVRLRREAFREVDPGTIQPLFLGLAGKTVAMMVVTDDSPAKQHGKDAMFQLCSEACASALQTALREEMGV